MAYLNATTMLIAANIAAIIAAIAAIYAAFLALKAVRICEAWEASLSIPPRKRGN